MLEPYLALTFGPTEWILVAVLVVLLFGAAKIPELARSLGRAKSEFHQASRDAEREVAADAEKETGKKPEA